MKDIYNFNPVYVSMKDTQKIKSMFSKPQSGKVTGCAGEQNFESSAKISNRIANQFMLDAVTQSNMNKRSQNQKFVNRKGGMTESMSNAYYAD